VNSIISEHLSSMLHGARRRFCMISSAANTLDRFPSRREEDGIGDVCVTEMLHSEDAAARPGPAQCVEA